MQTKKPIKDSAKTIIIAIYSQNGRDLEDYWSDSEIVSDENSLYKFMREMHRRSASTFGDTVFGGMFSPDSVVFQKQLVIYDEDGNPYYGLKENTEKPDFFQGAEKKFHALIEEAELRLPRIRQAKEKRKKHEILNVSLSVLLTGINTKAHLMQRFQILNQKIF